MRPGEDRPGEVRSAEIPLAEDRVAEIRRSEDCSVEVCLGQMCHAEMRPAEGRPAKVDLLEDVLNPPLIPGLYALLEDGELLLIGRRLPPLHILVWPGHLLAQATRRTPGTVACPRNLTVVVDPRGCCRMLTAS